MLPVWLCFPQQHPLLVACGTGGGQPAPQVHPQGNGAGSPTVCELRCWLVFWERSCLSALGVHPEGLPLRVFTVPLSPEGGATALGAVMVSVHACHALRTDGP